MQRANKSVQKDFSDAETIRQKRKFTLTHCFRTDKTIQPTALRIEGIRVRCRSEDLAVESEHGSQTKKLETCKLLPCRSAATRPVERPTRARSIVQQNTLRTSYFRIRRLGSFFLAVDRSYSFCCRAHLIVTRRACLPRTRFLPPPPPHGLKQPSPLQEREMGVT